MPYKIVQGDTLGKIAQTNNTTVQNLMSLNPNITNPNKIYAGQNLNLSSNVIPATNMAPMLPLQFPPVAPDTTNYPGMTNGVANGLQSIVDTNLATTTANRDAQKQKNTDTQDMILALMKQEDNKAADTIAANTTAGVDAASEKFNNYSAEIDNYNIEAKQLAAEAGNAPNITQENNQNTGATDAGVAPQTAGALRQNAIKAYTLSQKAAIAEYGYNNSKTALARAEKSAQNIIDLKYLPIENKLKTLKQQLEFNKEALTSIDAKRTEALNAKIKKDEADVETAKANDKTMNDTLFKAMQGGAPTELTSSVQDSINKGTATVSQVNQMLAEYTLNLPASAQEYQFAVRNGYKGSFTQYQNEDANRKAKALQATPTVRSGGMIIPETVVSQGQQALDKSRGSDGYGNTDLYLAMLGAWKKDGGLEQDFFTKYPPKNYLNPSEGEGSILPKYIKDKLKEVEQREL